MLVKWLLLKVKKFLKIAYPDRSKLRGITAIFRVGISNSP